MNFYPMKNLGARLSFRLPRVSALSRVHAFAKKINYAQLLKNLCNKTKKNDMVRVQGRGGKLGAGRKLNLASPHNLLFRYFKF